MEELTIYEKYDKLLKANTNLSVLNSELEEKLNTQKNSLEVCKAAFNTIYDNCSDTDLIIDICDMQLNKTLEAV